MKKDNSRIAFVLGGMGNGGAERVVSILSNHYASVGYKVDIITLLNGNSTYNLSENVNIINLSNANKPRILQIITWVKGLRNYIKTYSPYRIVSFFGKINVIVGLTLLEHIHHIIFSERNDPTKDGRNFVVKYLTKKLYPRAKKIIFQTEIVQSYFTKEIINNSVVVKNPVTEFSSYNLEKKKKIVNVGKLSDQKNHALLIKAFSKITAKYDGYIMEIYGEGENRKELEKLIRELDLQHKVFLLGWVENVHEKIAESTCFVLSSDYEGLSNALLEAMVLGVPCISSNCAGSTEIIKNNFNGLIFEVGNEDELIQKMCLVLDNHNWAKRMGLRAYEDTKKYGISNIIKEWEKVIE